MPGLFFVAFSTDYSVGFRGIASKKGRALLPGLIVMH